MRMLLCAVGVIVAFAGCDEAPIPTDARAGASTPPTRASPFDPPRSCSGPFPIEPTYLPDGFSRRLYRGPAEGGRGPDRRRQSIAHFRSHDGRSIELRRPGTPFSELAQADTAPTITVLGSETSAFGPIAPGGDEYIVQFTYPKGASANEECALYSLNEYGLALRELKRVAEGLRRRS